MPLDHGDLVPQFWRTEKSHFGAICSEFLNCLHSQNTAGSGANPINFYILGRCKIKSYCCLNDLEKCNPANMLGCCVLTF